MSTRGRQLFEAEFCSRHFREREREKWGCLFVLCLSAAVIYDEVS